MSENQSRKPVRKIPRLLTRNKSNTKNKAYNGEKNISKLKLVNFAPLMLLISSSLLHAWAGSQFQINLDSTKFRF